MLLKFTNVSTAERPPQAEIPLNNLKKKDVSLLLVSFALLKANRLQIGI